MKGKRRKPMSDETKRKIGEANKISLKGKHHTLETKLKMGDSHKGHIVSPETKLKISLANTGKKRTEETKQKMSERKKGKSTWNKGKHHTEEHKKNLSIAQRKRFSKNSLPWKDTKPEQEAENILKKYNLNYKKQKVLKYKDTGKYYDFYLPDYNILLEIDGIYWHGKGIKDEDIKNKTLKYNRINDKLKDKLAQEQGYTLIRIWQDELYKLEEYCSKELNNLYI